MTERNFILDTDSYKLTHNQMYPHGTEYIGSYFESRPGAEYPETVFFGLNYILQRYFAGTVVTREAIEEASTFCEQHFGNPYIFNREGWEYILHRYDGRLPISIRAVPEGMVVPTSNVLVTIENTDPYVPWLTNHCETALVQLWYPSTVATISREMKKVLKESLERTGTLANLPFMLHDFGFRGSASIEGAGIGGAAHLLNFMGTDTIAGIQLLRTYYDAQDMPGFSVPAAEHSTITAWGEDGEEAAYRNILNTFPTGIVSVVSDSWNIYYACEKLWGGSLREAVAGNEERRLVVRPDSGDPHTVIQGCLDILGEKFGYTTNAKGYKVLPENVRIIQGDGINRRTLPALVMSIENHGWSLDNMVFGSGGGLLQDCNRDTQRFALKCSWAVVNGARRDVHKEPITDVGKRSKRGQIKLVEDVVDTLTTVSVDDPRPDVMHEVFRNEDILVRPTLNAMRERADA